MSDIDNLISITKDNNIEISNREYRKIPYYTMAQVASLLNEDESSIRYYTNLFDDILNIEIVNKEFRFTPNNVDNLDFLINLKNKGMTIKEIQEYCKELPLSKEEIVVQKSNNVSVNDIITVLMNEQTKNFNELKNSFFSEIERSVSESICSLSKQIIEENNKQLKSFKEELFSELKNYINEEFETLNEKNSIHNTHLIESSKQCLTESLNEKYNTFELIINKAFDDFAEKSITRDDNLIGEVKKFKEIIQQAYFVQHEVDMQFDNLSLMERIFGKKSI